MHMHHIRGEISRKPMSPKSVSPTLPLLIVVVFYKHWCQTLHREIFYCREIMGIVFPLYIMQTDRMCTIMGNRFPTAYNANWPNGYKAYFWVTISTMSTPFPLPCRWLPFKYAKWRSKSQRFGYVLKVWASIGIITMLQWQPTAQHGPPISNVPSVIANMMWNSIKIYIYRYKYIYIYIYIYNM